MIQKTKTITAEDQKKNKKCMVATNGQNSENISTENKTFLNVNDTIAIKTV